MQRWRALGGFAAILAMILGWGVAAGAQPTGSVEGTVTNAETGEPLAGLLVNIGNQNFAGIGETDDNGVYRIDGLPVGPATVFAGGEAQWQDFEVPVTVAEGVQTFDIQLSPAPVGSVTGVVTDALTGEPLAGISVDVVVAGVLALGTTDAGGRYVQENLAVGPAEISAGDGEVAWETFTASITITEGTQTFDIQLTPRPFATIEGTVTDVNTGRPISDVFVNVGSPRFVGLAESDRAGRFQIEAFPLPPNEGSVSADREGWVRLEPQPIDLNPGTVVLSLQLEPVAVGSFEGIVTDAATGLPISGIGVTVTASGVTVEAVTDTLGIYRVDAMPVGATRITSGGTTRWLPFETSVTLEGGTQLVDIQLTPAPPALAFTGARTGVLAAIGAALSVAGLGLVAFDRMRRTP